MLNGFTKRFLASIPAVWCALFVLDFCTAFAQKTEANPNFTSYRLPLTQELGSVVSIDIEQDGQAEMLVLEVERLADRSFAHSLELFKRQGNTWQAQAAAKASLPKRVLFMDAGHTAYGPSLVFATPGELHLWAWEKGFFQPTARINLPALRGPPIHKAAQRIRMLQDLSGDGLAEGLLPLYDGVLLLRIFGPQGGMVADLRVQGGEYATLYKGTPSNQWIHWIRWPDVRLVDVDGVGWKDILLFNDGVVVIQPLGKGGKPAAQGVLSVDVEPVKPFDPKKHKRPHVNLARAGDLNGDGVLDLIVYKIMRGKKVFESRMSTAVYYGQKRDAKGLAFGHIPDQIFISQGVGFPILDDFNADGLTDLAVVQVDIGFWDLVKGLIARKFSGEALYRLMGKNGRYAREPNAVRKYDVNISLTHQPTILFADLNGDGHDELLLSKKTNTLGIHWGKKSGFWEEDAQTEWRGIIPTRTNHIVASALRGQHASQMESLIFAYDRSDARIAPDVYRQLLIIEHRAKP